jgi:hypothetical protein
MWVASLFAPTPGTCTLCQGARIICAECSLPKPQHRQHHDHPLAESRHRFLAVRCPACASDR